MIVIAITFVAFAVSACQTSMKGETFKYTSTNVPSDFWSQAGYLAHFPINLSGKLFLPEGKGPFPVVVWGPPSTIKSNALALWRSDLRNALISNNIGIFFNDSYTGRGLPRKVNSNTLNSASRYLDGVRILNALSKHPKINPNKIGISGASYGANIAMRLQWEYYMNMVQPDGLRYAAHVAIYPPCSTRIKGYKSTGSPMLIFIGEQDYNKVERCRERLKELRQDGAQIELVTYPGVYHCYIASFSPRMVTTPVYSECGLQIIDIELGYKYRDIAEKKWPFCVKKQGMCGGNRSATKDTLDRTIAFFVEHLK